MKIRQGWSVAPGNGLFVTDLDGTLLNDAKRFTAVDLAALRWLRQAGVRIVLATGRSNHSLARLLEGSVGPGTGTNLPLDYLVFATGAGIMEFPSGRVCRSVSLGAQEVQYIVSVLKHKKLDFMVHRPVPDTVHFLHSPPSSDNPDFLRRLQLYRDFATPLSADLLDNLKGATEVLCIASEDTGHGLADELAGIFGQFSVIKATSPLDHKSLWIEIFAASVCKSAAVRWLTEEIGIARDSVCAVGNDYNDLDLLSWAGKSFVVANSPASLRASFPVVASNNNGGVAEAAVRWLSRG